MPQLSGGDKLARVDATDPQTGSLFRTIFAGINKLASNMASSAVGEVSAPQPITGINMAVGSDSIHYSLEHPGPINRGIQYFSEVATDPAFSNVVTIRHHGASRTPEPMSLPAKTSAGVVQSYYVRAYAQYHGGPPSQITNYGGPTPIPITLSGTSQGNFAPSTGSGTASNGGGQSGFGLGRFPVREK